MNTTDKSKASNVLGGKTARACDSCLLKRARWYCVADDAFLCQSCDNSVHSANQLASRHERVRLETSSFKVRDTNSSPPAWHQGFTRKARTPRPAKAALRVPAASNHQLPLVPEINCEEAFPEENDEQLLCRVPVFDAFGGEDVPFDLNEDIGSMMLDDDVDLNLEQLLTNCDEELTVFAADVESLIGKEDSGCGNKELGLGVVDCEDEHKVFDEFSDGNKVKIEKKNEEDDDDDEVKAVIACQFDPSLDLELNWDFDYASSIHEEVKTTLKNDVGINESQAKGRMLLRLNYEAVIAAWATQGSPWTDGIRPRQFNLDEFMVACLGGSGDEWGRVGRRNNEGREARVSRYREKRRTRLFSKKIRYEVRKLNAEKRPRMKGRFVKRTTFSSSSLPLSALMNK